MPLLDDEDYVPGPQSYEEDVPCIRCLGSTGRAEGEPDPNEGLCIFCVHFLDGKSTWDPTTPIVTKEKGDAKTG